MQRCHGCRTEELVGGVVRTEMRNGKRVSHCRSCVEKMAPGLARLQFRRAEVGREMRRLYGIDISDYERLYQFQSGRCAICRDRPNPSSRLVVDHDHRSGEVRGLLCNRCNLVLGQMKDRKEWLHDARLYLERPPWVKEAGSELTVEEQIALRRKKRQEKLQQTVDNNL